MVADSVEDLEISCGSELRFVCMRFSGLARGCSGCAAVEQRRNRF
jgi:hypothetical protein